MVNHEQFKLIADAFHKGSPDGLIIVHCIGSQAPEVSPVRVEVVAFLATSVARLCLLCQDPQIHGARVVADPRDYRREQ